MIIVMIPVLVQLNIAIVQKVAFIRMFQPNVKMTAFVPITGAIAKRVANP